MNQPPRLSKGARRRLPSPGVPRRVRRAVAVGGVVVALSLLVVTLPALAADDDPSADAPLERIDRERLGTKLYNQRRSFGLHRGSLTFTSVTDMVHGAGQGHNLMLWRRATDADLWQVVPIRPDRKPTMISIVPLEHRDGETLIVYVDRQDEDDRVVYVDRLAGDDRLEPVFDYADTRGVLNPVCVPVPERDLVYLFIPDRGAEWRVRWFRIDLADDSVRRLEDIPMPQRGARLFGHHRDGDRLILPVGLAQQLHVLEIDLAEQTHRLTQVDEADSPDNQPCREVDIHHFPEHGLYLLTYLRPTDFSDRPRTGLLGEVVANTLDARSLESVERTVIGGFSAEEAATHQIASAPVADDAFVAAWTTVDRVHQRHLTAEFVNYVAGHIDRWQVHDDGSLTREGGHRLPPFWRVDLAVDRDAGILYMIAADTQPHFPLWLERWRISSEDIHRAEEKNGAGGN